MPDNSVTLPGRCPTCGQSLVLPTEEIISQFACPRCGTEERGTALLDHSGGASNGDAMQLSAFDEDGDAATRMHDPSALEPGAALPAVRVGGPASSKPPSSQKPPLVAPPPHSAPGLSRFSENVEEPTRLHMPLSFEDDDDDEPEEKTGVGQRPKLPAEALLAKAAENGRTASELSAFTEDTDADQQTSLSVPLSYDAPGARPLSAPPPRPPSSPAQPAATSNTRSNDSSVLPPRVQTPAFSIPPQQAPSLPAPYEASPEPVVRRGLLDHFGHDMLQLSIQIDRWLRPRRTVVLAIAALSTGVFAPLLDIALHSTREASTVIASNLMLFVLWLFAFAWTGRRRNDAGQWDSQAVFDRLKSHHKLVWTELAWFPRLPLASRYQTISELLMPVGVLGLTVASSISVCRTVWGWPQTTAGLFFLRFAGAAIVLVALLARHQSQVRQGSSHGPGLDASASTTKQFPAIVDLQQPVPATSDPGNTFVKEVIQALSLWHPADWPNLDCYRLAMHRHLLARMPWASLDIQPMAPGSRRSDAPDLVINGTVLLRLRRGYDQALSGQATEQMQIQSKVWGLKPTLFVLFESPMNFLQGTNARAFEDVHRTHPVVFLRMPQVS